MMNSCGSISWDRDALIEHSLRGWDVYGRWDRIFGSWRAEDAGAPARPFMPAWSLVSPSGRLCAGRFVDDEMPVTVGVDRSPRHDDAHGAATKSGLFPDELLPDDVAHNSVPTAPELFQRYVDLIPLQIRRVAGAFGSWQWIILWMIWNKPEFADFLRGEIEMATPNFVIACLLLSGAEACDTVGRRNLCRAIMHEKRASLMRRAGALRSPRGAVRVISRVQLASIGAETRRELLKVLSEPSKIRFVGNFEILTPRILSLAAKLPAWICIDKISRHLRESPDDRSFDATLLALAELVQQEPGDWRERIRRSLHRAGSGKHLVSLIGSWHQCLVEVRTYPSPPLPASGCLKPISSAAMLRSESRVMNNCIRDYLNQVLCGDSYFYVWKAEERATIHLKRNGAGRWDLESCAGARNGLLTEQTDVEIRAALRAAGISRSAQ